jgi:mono/diheme cytochrome c family protein
VKYFSIAALALLSGAGAVLTPAMGDNSSLPSVLTGAYTEAQAIRGQTLYNEHCWTCHGETLAGLDQAPPLVGPQFSGIWSGETLWALVSRIGTMPPDKPGTLARAENVDILAYMLWYNGLPIGDAELATGQSVLTEMTFETPPIGQ